MFYFVTFKSESCLFGAPGTFGLTFDLYDAAADFAASLAGTDATDVTIETHEGGWESDESDTRPDAAGEMVEVQLGPALTPTLD